MRERPPKLQENSRSLVSSLILYHSQLSSNLFELISSPELLQIGQLGPEVEDNSTSPEIND